MTWKGGRGAPVTSAIFIIRTAVNCLLTYHLSLYWYCCTVLLLFLAEYGGGILPPPYIYWGVSYGSTRGSSSSSCCGVTLLRNTAKLPSIRSIVLSCHYCMPQQIHLCAWWQAVGLVGGPHTRPPFLAPAPAHPTHFQSSPHFQALQIGEFLFTAASCSRWMVLWWLSVLRSFFFSALLFRFYCITCCRIIHTHIHVRVVSSVWYTRTSS